MKNMENMKNASRDFSDMARAMNGMARTERSTCGPGRVNDNVEQSQPTFVNGKLVGTRTAARRPSGRKGSEIKRKQFQATVEDATESPLLITPPSSKAASRRNSSARNVDVDESVTEGLKPELGYQACSEFYSPDRGVPIVKKGTSPASVHQRPSSIPPTWALLNTVRETLGDSAGTTPLLRSASTPSPSAKFPPLQSRLAAKKRKASLFGKRDRASSSNLPSAPSLRLGTPARACSVHFGYPGVIKPGKYATNTASGYYVDGKDKASSRSMAGITRSSRSLSPVAPTSHVTRRMSSFVREHTPPSVRKTELTKSAPRPLPLSAVSFTSSSTPTPTPSPSLARKLAATDVALGAGRRQSTTLVPVAGTGWFSTFKQTASLRSPGPSFDAKIKRCLRRLEALEEAATTVREELSLLAGQLTPVEQGETSRRRTV